MKMGIVYKIDVSCFSTRHQRSWCIAPHSKSDNKGAAWNHAK